MVATFTDVDLRIKREMVRYGQPQVAGMLNCLQKVTDQYNRYIALITGGTELLCANTTVFLAYAYGEYSTCMG